jgi:hypothetical protein
MPFVHVAEAIIGHDKETRLRLTGWLLRLGFPEGAIAWCPTCNDVQEFTLEEATERVESGTWPRCHDRRMLMADPGDAPPF